MYATEHDGSEIDTKKKSCWNRYWKKNLYHVGKWVYPTIFLSCESY